jgi:hypothetical protein
MTMAAGVCFHPLPIPPNCLRIRAPLDGGRRRQAAASPSGNDDCVFYANRLA